MFYHVKMLRTPPRRVLEFVESYAEIKVKYAGTGRDLSGYCCPHPALRPQPHFLDGSTYHLRLLCPSKLSSSFRLSHHFLHGGVAVYVCTEISPLLPSAGCVRFPTREVVRMESLPPLQVDATLPSAVYCYSDSG